MADKLRLGNEIRELKIGQSFTNSRAGAFHTIRYDFKPASVDINKIATVDIGSNNQVTVTVPHLDGAGVPQTVFKGSHRPFQKECVLIIDKITGEITLEKLTSNIQVKKTRSESTMKPSLEHRGERSNNRPQTPPNSNIVGQRQSNKTRVTSGSRRPDRPITHLPPKHSPLHASPNPNYSPGHKSPKRERDHESHAPSQLASLPMIGIDDFTDHHQHQQSANDQNHHHHHHHHNQNHHHSSSDNEQTNNGANAIGEISDSTSSDSSSDSESDSTLPTTHQQQKTGKANGHSSNGMNPPPAATQQTNKLSMPTQLLNDDLCLSESGSDSD